MCHKLDVRFFTQLAAMDPQEVCRRSLCKFEPDAVRFIVRFWEEEYAVYPLQAGITKLPENVPVSNVELGLTILFYLLNSRDIPVRGEWISEKDIPGGVSFFQGPHAIPVHVIVKRYRTDIEGFHRICKRKGGKPVDMGDAAYSFHILPGVPVAVIFWKEDDEFGADARILFDRTISENLPLDVIFGLSIVVCGRLSQASI